MSELEEKLRNMCLWEGEDSEHYDIDTAMELVSEHENLNDEFDTLIDLLESCSDDIDDEDVLDMESTTELIEKLMDLRSESGSGKDSTLPAVMNFFASVGGVQFTWKLYEKVLDTLNLSSVSEMAVVARKNDKPEVQTAKAILQRVRRIWMFATDQSQMFAVDLGRVGVLAKLAEEIDLMYTNTGMNATRRSILMWSLMIAHNCAQCDDLRLEFRETSTPEGKTFLQLFSELLSSDDVEIKLAALLAMSYIIDDDEADLLQADEEFDFLLDNINVARSSASHRDNYGYKLEELLMGLHNLTKNDDSKRLLMEKGVLERVLQPILTSGDTDEKGMACEIVWELAWNDENKQEMTGNGKLLGLIKKLTKDKDEDLAEGANGTLFFLNTPVEDEGSSDDEEPAAKGSGPAKPVSGHSAKAATSGTGGGHIMISYCHKNKEVVKQVAEALRKRRYNVWIDEEQMKGFTMDAMSEAVEESAVVLMCMSQNYKDSKPCRGEAIYADQQDKLLIPLKVEKDYKAKGWLGMLLGDKLFYDFSGKYEFEKKFEELVQAIGSRGKK